jgi:hypothetical protein
MNTADVKAAADAIRDEINPNFAAETARDEGAVVAVLAELGLPNTPANHFQVAAALHSKDVVTRDEYPKAKYHADEPYVIVSSKEQEDALGDGWLDEHHADAVGPAFTRKRQVVGAPEGTLETVPWADPYRPINAPATGWESSTNYADRLSNDIGNLKQVNAQAKAKMDKDLDDRIAALRSPLYPNYSGPAPSPARARADAEIRRSAGLAPAYGYGGRADGPDGDIDGRGNGYSDAETRSAAASERDAGSPGHTEPEQGPIERDSVNARGTDRGDARGDPNYGDTRTQAQRNLDDQAETARRAKKPIPA